MIDHVWAKDIALGTRMGFLPKPEQREVFMCDLMKNRDLALELPHCRLGLRMLVSFFKQPSEVGNLLPIFKNCHRKFWCPQHGTFVGNEQLCPFLLSSKTVLMWQDSTSQSALVTASTVLPERSSTEKAGDTESPFSTTDGPSKSGSPWISQRLKAKCYNNSENKVCNLTHIRACLWPDVTASRPESSICILLPVTTL